MIKTDTDEEFEKKSAEFDRRYFAAHLLAGFHASGRKFTVYNGKEISLEEAAVISTDRLLAELNKEKK